MVLGDRHRRLELFGVLFPVRDPSDLLATQLAVLNSERQDIETRDRKVGNQLVIYLPSAKAAFMPPVKSGRIKRLKLSHPFVSGLYIVVHYINKSIIAHDTKRTEGKV